MSLPPATPKPCNECPWRRAALPGWLGPQGPEAWLEAVHSDAPIACHETIKEVGDDGVGSWDHPKMKQCAGAAIFRANVFKSPRDPEVARADKRDTETVFADNAEFVAHHKSAWDRLQKLLKRKVRT